MTLWLALAACTSTSTQPGVPSPTDVGAPTPTGAPPPTDAPQPTASPTGVMPSTAMTGATGTTGDTGTPALADTGTATTADTGTTFVGPTGLVVTLVPPPLVNVCTGSPTSSSHFADVSTCTGVNAWHIYGAGGTTWYSTGQGWLDVDHDGRLDLVVTSHDGSNRLYRGTNDGRFVEDTPAALQGLLAGPVAIADVDHDGHRDVLIGGRGESWMLRGNGTTLVSGPLLPSTGQTQGIGMGDLDRDGWLEAYFANYHCSVCFPAGTPTIALTTDQMFRFDGQSWNDMSAELGPALLRSGMGFLPQFTDIDDDGDLDILVVNDKGTLGTPPATGPLNRNAVFRNDGPGCGGQCFTEVAETIGADTRLDGMGAAIGDFDADQDRDIVLTDSFGLWLLEKRTGGYMEHFQGNGLSDTFVSWGVVAADFDNDGDLDITAASSNADVYYDNDGTGQFVKLLGTGVEDSRRTYGMAQADYDRDGRVDLVLGDPGWGYRLLRNVNATTGHWVGVELQGRGIGGTSALGAIVQVTDSQGRMHQREVAASSSLGAAHDPGLHFGLGTATIVSAQVRWPDGVVDPLTLQLDRWHRVNRP